ncbi:hypothetical protein [Brevibacillus sp. HD3.3A]|uniref:hypothetical protein n=1 Tax=Brevibacillus sp. HD3.3A TaxID=2738979 RepID=UPI00156BD0F2|nr:hypothetical protein [Brevibacillus sp. HD3.3A]UED72120.1 hypothetical protein HP435_28865 [Brevibacillus sp. HD3.3A]
MMIIINDNIRITNDGRHNLIIEERKLVRSTKEGVSDRYEWDVVGYFGNLQALCIALIDVVTVRSEAQSLEELMNELRRLRDEIIRTVQQMKESENNALP